MSIHEKAQWAYLRETIAMITLKVVYLLKRPDLGRPMRPICLVR
jgi:hypothetical protein